MLYEAADLALDFHRMGSPARTPAAIRARVRTGDMTPDDRTPRGCGLWTEEGREREIASEAYRMRLAKALGIARGDTSVYLRRRGELRQPVQVRLELGA